MSIPGRRPPATPQAVAIMSVLAVVAIAAMLWFATSLARSDNVDTRLGDEQFIAGQVGRISAAIDSGGPALYSDVAGGDRDIWVQHLGDDPETGWHVFEVRPPGSERGCFAQWESDVRVFRDNCNGTEYPEDGTGLALVESSIVNGQVIIDLNAADRDAPEPTTPESTTSSIVISGG